MFDVADIFSLSLIVLMFIYIYIKWTVFVNVTTKIAQHAHARMIAKTDLIHREAMRPLYVCMCVCTVSHPI